MPDTSLAVAITLLETISAQLDALPRAIVAAQRERGRALSKSDREALAILLPEISQSIGNRMFTVKELVDHARVADVALLAAIERALGPIVPSSTVKRIGRLLHRADCFTLGGLAVERIGSCRDGALWTVTQV